LEFALKSGDYWEIGAGIQELEKELIFECYTKSSDTTPVRTSKVVITPKDINYVADSEETKNYAITKEGKFIEIDTVEANDNNTYPAQLQIPERLKNKFSYDAKTDTVTMDNVGTAGKNTFIIISSKNFYIKGNNNKIVNGYTNGKFGANDNITREQLAVILSNYCKYKGKYKATNANYSKFSDSGKISGFAKTGMNWAVGNKIVNGSNGKLNPQGTATRAEAAAMIYNYCIKIK
jgi:hypothetical protein